MSQSPPHSRWFLKPQPLRSETTTTNTCAQHLQNTCNTCKADVTSGHYSFNVCSSPNFNLERLDPVRNACRITHTSCDVIIKSSCDVIIVRVDASSCQDCVEGALKSSGSTTESDARSAEEDERGRFEWEVESPSSVTRQVPLLLRQILFQIQQVLPFTRTCPRDVITTRNTSTAKGAVVKIVQFFLQTSAL